MLITREALQLVIRIIVSCYFVMDNAERAKSARLVHFLKLESSVYSCLTLVRGDFGKAFKRVVQELCELAIERHEEEIVNELTVVEYFGGQIHLNYIRRVFVEEDFDLDVYNTLFVFHILLPVILTNSSANQGVYENENFRILLANLKNPFLLPLIDGRTYYTHFGTIVAIAGESEDARGVNALILSQQQKDDDFCRLANGITQLDFEHFWKDQSF